MDMIRTTVAATLTCACIALGSGCATTENLLNPRLAFRLPKQYQSPAGMSIGDDNCVYLAVNNAGAGSKFKHPAKILRITPEDELQEVATLPAHSVTKVASPVGLAFAKNGNLYVSDNQGIKTSAPGQSRLLRVTFDKGRFSECHTVAFGLNEVGGLACRGDYVYICDARIDTKYPLFSGVYRFNRSELHASKPLPVTGLSDPHLILTLKTYNKAHQLGARSLCFDARGNLYVTNFGDKEVYKVTFDARGNVSSKKVIAKGNGLKSVAGITVDLDDNLWVADPMGNAVAKISAGSRKLTIIAKNDPGDGIGGALDAPAECIRRGNRLYVSNMDLTYGPNRADDLHTISVITIEE